MDGLVRLTDTIVSTSAYTNSRIDAMGEAVNGRLDLLNGRLDAVNGRLDVVVDALADLRVDLNRHLATGHGEES